MSIYWIVAGLVVASLASLLFSTITYSLRDVTRSRLADYLERGGQSNLLDLIMDHLGDLIFVTAVGRLFANTLIVICALAIFERTDLQIVLRYLLATIVAGVISLVVSVAIPHALAANAGNSIAATFASSLNGFRIVMLPFTKFMHLVEKMVKRVTGAPDAAEPEHIGQEILSVVEEGEKEGVVDEQQREMIESVIEFRDTTVGQIMSARPEIIGLESTATLDQVKESVEASGHSRLPVYEGTLDKIVGVLYARDLLKYLGLPPEQFDIRKAMRPPLYVPESKPLRDLLQDFRHQKVHIAIVLDEYGGTAGLVTIEDILEELVGEISDEHEPRTPAMIKRVDELTTEVDARVYIDELNRTLGLGLPEDAGYDTLGGFVSTTLGKIPESGTVFDHAGTKYTVLDAEPQKVNRVRIEQTLQPVEETAPTTTPAS